MPYKNREDRLRWAREKYARNPVVKEQTLKRQQKRRKLGKEDFDYHHKQSVRYKLRHAVKIGKIKKLPCDVCGDKKSQAHHPDYTKPLEVIWLCSLHHGEIHRRAL